MCNEQSRLRNTTQYEIILISFYTLCERVPLMWCLCESRLSSSRTLSAVENVFDFKIICLPKINKKISLPIVT